MEAEANSTRATNSWAKASPSPYKKIHDSACEIWLQNLIRRRNVRKIKEKLGFKSYRVRKVPNLRDKQNENARKRALKLCNNVLIKHRGCMIQDDENYLKCDFQQIPDQEFNSRRVGKVVDYKFKQKYVDKFAKKYMIWQAICSCGRRTSPYVITETLKSREYIKEFSEKRVLPMYRQHNVSPLFWHDLASINYSRDTISWYEENEVAFVKKIHYPPNSPELRPIERYWAILKLNAK